MTNQYDIVYRESIDDPEKFWGRVAEDCHRYKKWDKVLDDSNKPFFRWFTGGDNTCYNALDYHVDESGPGRQNRHYLRQSGDRHHPKIHLCGNPGYCGCL
ncbi:MAG: acetyl-coenzyme A synthetase N-terminal domain-containing protein [Desulfobacterales bacterium]